MTRVTANKPKKARAPKAHKLPDKLPLGEELTDVFKKKWKVGQSIGSGGFGLLYLVSPADEYGTGKDAKYVLKCEPHANGPLFCELHFYQRVAKRDTVAAWMQSQKLKSLGMPKYISSGNHEFQKKKYRFMVMERFGQDLQKYFENNGKMFNLKTVLQIGIKVLYVLEYIHSQGYVHADIKAANLLEAHNPNQKDEIFLVDYGLATRYTEGQDGKHKDYKEDPRKAHDGTAEFTSIDAHKGVAPSRRGDLEILGYCMLQWMCGELPWEDNLVDKEYIHKQKSKFMSDIPCLMKVCFPDGDAPDVIKKYLLYVSKLKYDAKPDYSKLRADLGACLKKLGGSDRDQIVLSESSTSMKKLPYSQDGSSSEAAEEKSNRAAKRKLTPRNRASSPPPVKSPKRRTLRVSPRSRPQTKVLSPTNYVSPVTGRKRKHDMATQVTPGLKSNAKESRNKRAKVVRKKKST